MEIQCILRKQNTFLQRDLHPVEGILVSLMPDGVLSFWSVPILWPSAKQSIEFSNDISVTPCNTLDVLPVNVYTSAMCFLSANLETSSSYASMVTTPAFLILKRG
jgi:hypothetical protein